MDEAREVANRSARLLERGRQLVLWLGMLAPPSLFLIGLGVAYTVVPFACRDRSPVTLHITSFAFLIATLAPGVLAWREWRRAGSEWPDDGHGVEPSERFMAALGTLGSAFFALLVIAQWAAMLVVPYCRR